MQSLPKKSLLPFTEEHEAFRKEFGEFLDREIVPYYMDMEKNHSVGKETFKKFGDAGYGCLWLDKKYGGRELDMLYSIVYGEELNKRGLNGVLTRLSSDTVAPYIYAHGTEEQKAKYLPGVASGDTCICICMTEAEHGSDLAHIETSAVKDGKGNYIVNGGKFISPTVWFPTMRSLRSSPIPMPRSLTRASAFSSSQPTHRASSASCSTRSA